jgi:small subunit ribosomal protein S6
VRVSVSTAPRHYELLLLPDPTLDERPVAPSIDTFLNVVRQGGGSVENVDIWGKRRLAYEIQKNAEGIYAVINVNAPSEVVAELDRQLNLNESVLRTKITRPNAK